jgi:hypothetical protein
MYMVANSQKSIGSQPLAKQIGVAQTTAGFMLQRLRDAQRNPQPSRVQHDSTPLDVLTAKVFACPLNEDEE